jgi:uncharacterized membrane protein
MKTRKSPAFLIAFVAVMAAAAFVSNFLSIPVGTSRIHLGNSIALLAGMLFGGPLGALASGLGSALFDIVYGFADPAAGGAIPPILEAVVTFINKGLMALACGIIVNDRRNRLPKDFVVYIGAIAGAFLYVALFLIKTNLYSGFAGGHRTCPCADIHHQRSHRHSRGSLPLCDAETGDGKIRPL